MIIIGCDFHTRFQQIASMNMETGQVEQKRLEHSGEAVRNYYASLPKPVRVGIESTGYSLWFDQLLHSLGVELVVGDAATIASRRVQKQKNDQRDADLILKLLVREEFPAIYWPSAQVRDDRTLLSHRHRLVRLRTRMKNTLQAIALSQRKALGRKLFTRAGLEQLGTLQPLPYMARSQEDSLALIVLLDHWIAELDQAVEKRLTAYPESARLRTHPGVGPLTALATVLVLGPVTRFSGPKSVTSYVGLVPEERSSGGHQSFGRMTKQGNRLLRYLTIQAGLSAARIDPGLQRMYQRLTQRKGPQKAKAAVGRKLLVRLYIMLRDNIDYAEFCRRGARRPV